MDIKPLDIVLCKFYFSDLKSYKNRPVLIFKDNLPFNDFVCMAISSRCDTIYEDEMIVDNSKLLDGSLPKKSKIMIRKTFLIQKDIVIKKYATLKDEEFQKISKQFCDYYGCLQEESR